MTCENKQKICKKLAKTLEEILKETPDQKKNEVSEMLARYTNGYLGIQYGSHCRLYRAEK